MSFPSVQLPRAPHEGKRCVRRKENAHFVGNPHVVAASLHDYFPPPTSVQTTFPIPLPPYLPRTTLLPNASPPLLDPTSANAGRFSLSLKGMRRDLRKAGPMVQHIVREVEYELLQWLQQTGGEVGQDQHHSNEGLPIGTTGSILELSRTPLELVWSIPEASFVRFVVHCCARYHNVVSFSKDVNGSRLTYLLRPNVIRPDHQLPHTLETPPSTDYNYSSQIDTDESDIDSIFSDENEIGDLESVPPLACIPGLRESTDAAVGDRELDADSDAEAHVSVINQSSQSIPPSRSTQRLTQLKPISSRLRYPKTESINLTERAPLFYDYLFS
ncbi:hypothetical protein BDN72DRAFT_878892 [Pluteus cervinus]|uniref:Uncharacterized protein n=1 Tax=Pluteus cervinus TaxID=181527 RepID=A0ACD3AST7_9AGAR|nr:hypothetical protein BDN72DRAFT_878892 [Pluteus cervinus]